MDKIKEEVSINADRAVRAADLFYQGYNCSQSVVGAFSDLLPLDFGTLMRLSSSFGGGMGRLREVCGAVSGMFIVLGLLAGYDEPRDHAAKTEHYRRIQQLAARFREQNGSIVCRELLGLSAGPDHPEPARRSESYYKKRPCPQIIAQAAGLLEQYLKENDLC